MNEVSRDQLDPAWQVAEVRQLIQHRGHHSCEATLIAIRRVVDPPADPEPLEYDEGGWPVIRPSGWQDTGAGPGYGGAVIELPDVAPSTAPERHDDPEADR